MPRLRDASRTQCSVADSCLLRVIGSTHHSKVRRKPIKRTKTLDKGCLHQVSLRHCRPVGHRGLRRFAQLIGYVANGVRIQLSGERSRQCQDFLVRDVAQPFRHGDPRNIVKQGESISSGGVESKRGVDRIEERERCSAGSGVLNRKTSIGQAVLHMGGSLAHMGLESACCLFSLGVEIELDRRLKPETGNDICRVGTPNDVHQLA